MNHTQYPTALEIIPQLPTLQKHPQENWSRVIKLTLKQHCAIPINVLVFTIKPFDSLTRLKLGEGRYISLL